MYCGFPVQVHDRLRPCGKCLGCRREYRRQWVGRMLIENLELGGDSAFVTLTYAQEPLVKADYAGGDLWIPTLVKSHAKNWLRSVRRKATSLGLPFRYFLAGEYGKESGRPHYHAILFGIGPSWSRDFESLWSEGFSYFKPANARTMAYVSKYCLKDGGDPEVELLEGLHVDVEGRVSVPPFRMTPRNPALGMVLASRIASGLGRIQRPMELLALERELKGSFHVGKDRYPIARIVRDELARQLVDEYGLDRELTRRMLGTDRYTPPDENEIANAKAAHVRARASRRSGAGGGARKDH